ncbi:molybdenum cofactor guanylyltransferase MobA [Marinobacter sp. OP 3.4]|uniref:molybdenum cofactor guanylyltransferase MobA n=1 Tax=Marinobacter sp. OP 3.4 TaxID=3076501 RepID=UPI002E1D0B81
MADGNHSPRIAGLILAGGEGRRMGGVDKGLVDWRGRPLVAWVLDALAPVVSPVWISANRSRGHYQHYSPRLVSDPEEFRWQGPLAGLLAGLRAAAEEGADAVLVSPCDTPNVTPELFLELLNAYHRNPGEPVFVQCGDRQHPLHGVYPVTLVPMLEQRLENGERKVMAFAEAAGAKPVMVGPETLLDNINRLGN